MAMLCCLRATDGFHDLASQRLADDAAYVISLEDFFGNAGHD
jgi:hypothetical protein